MTHGEDVSSSERLRRSAPALSGANPLLRPGWRQFELRTGADELIEYDGSCSDCGESPFRRLGMIYLARLARSLAVVLAVVAVLVVAYAPFAAPDSGRPGRAL